MKRQEEKQKHGWGGRVKPKSLKALAIAMLLFNAIPSEANWSDACIRSCDGINQTKLNDSLLIAFKVFGTGNDWYLLDKSSPDSGILEVVRIIGNRRLRLEFSKYEIANLRFFLQTTTGPKYFHPRHLESWRLESDSDTSNTESVSIATIRENGKFITGRFYMQRANKDVSPIWKAHFFKTTHTNDTIQEELYPRDVIVNKVSLLGFSLSMPDCKNSFKIGISSDLPYYTDESKKTDTAVTNKFKRIMADWKKTQHEIPQNEKSDTLSGMFSGKAENNVVVVNMLQLTGIATQNIYVKKNASLNLTGVCSGKVVVDTGATVNISGIVSGSIVVRGGNVKIYGIVEGGVMKESGEVFVHPDSKVSGY